MAYTKIVRNRTPSVRNRTGELNVQLPTVYCDLKPTCSAYRVLLGVIL